MSDEPFGRSRHNGEVRKRAPVRCTSLTRRSCRTFLFQLLRFALGPDHSVGSEQFVYFNAADPRKCLAPDAFVKLRVPDEPFPIWKTWERGGPPELAVEIVSPTEGTATSDWADELASYLECGVNELAIRSGCRRGRAAARLGSRRGRSRRTYRRRRSNPCTTLDLSWIVVPLEGEPVGLRLARDDGSLVLSG